jgi:bla regulator protein BlaR1
LPPALISDYTPQRPIPPSELSAAIERVGVPFAISVPAATMQTAQRAPEGWIPVLLGAVWAIGLVTLTHSWWLRWRSILAALRRSSPLHLPIDLKVMTSPEFREPGVFGIRRPILLLPDGLINRLTPQQLDAILKHELCHVHRRDNLAAAMHMVVEALFWFHPLVWWLGARLMEERERACDEEVLRMGSEPRVYAEGIIRICELYLESPLQCVAGVTGGNLEKRIETIMINRTACKLNFARRTVLAVAGVTALTIPIVVGIVNSPAVSAQTSTAITSKTGPSVPEWQTVAGSKMEFEVASIRQSPAGKFTPPNFPLDPGNAYASTGGRFSADFSVTTYITFAYKLSLTQEQRQSMVANFPKWVANDRFMIQAKAAKDNPTKDQMRLMMQSLLADRFQLSIHFETQEVPVFALDLVTPGKTGTRLRPHSEGLPCDSSATEPAHGSQAGSGVFPVVCDVTALERQSGGNLAGSRNTTMELIADALPSLGRLGRPVVDRTGLSGKFDFRLEWTPEPNGSPPNADTQPDLQGPTFLQALHDQLGLKLKSTKGPIRTLVIDHIERPSEN